MTGVGHHAQFALVGNGRVSERFTPGPIAGLAVVVTAGQSVRQPLILAQLSRLWPSLVDVKIV